jgi:hypothetical protein
MKMTTRALLNGVAVGGISTLALSFGSFDRAQAATISTLFNTGVNSAGTVTPGSDIHYSLAGSTTGSTPTAIAIGTFPPSTYNSFPNGAGDDNKSAWIGPNTSAFLDKVGTYTYSTQFSLSGLDASTASIQGKWNTDNSGLKLILNGVDVAATNPGFDRGGFSTFSLSSGFNSGINTLAFVVNNADRGDGADTPTALRVEYTSTSAQAIASEPVPEPSDLAGTAFAFGSVVFLKRKFGKKQSISK